MLTDMASWPLTFFSEDLAGGENYYSQDAARSRSVKGKYQSHRGQRSRSLCNFIGQQEKMSKGIIAGVFFRYISDMDNYE